MAYLNMQDLDERLTRLKGQGSAPSEGPVAKPGAGGPAFGPRSPGNYVPMVAPAAPTASSGQFQNLQQYLAMNAGKAGQMGTALAGKLTTQALGAEQQQAKLGSTAPSINTQTAGEQFGTLKGPANMPGYGAAVSATNAAQQGVNNTQSQAGRQTLMAQYFGAPGYTQGQQGLDAFLVGANPTSAAALSGVQSRFGGISGWLSGGQAPSIPGPTKDEGGPHKIPSPPGSTPDEGGPHPVGMPKLPWGPNRPVGSYPQSGGQEPGYDPQRRNGPQRRPYNPWDYSGGY